MKRAAQAAGGLLVLLGLFWAGRESDHGFGAFWEHWWCPIPLAAIIVGIVGVLIAQRPTPTA
jgi:hypothetical protein